MQKILIALAGLLLAGQLYAQQVALLVYEVHEQGVDPYISRILVTPDYLRLDEGALSDGYTLFDRQQEIIYNVLLDERSVLVIDQTDVMPGENDGLILQEQIVADKDAPKVMGRTPKNVRLLANGELCSELVVVEGVMGAALEALSELKLVLARIQAATMDAMPLEMRTPCELAGSIYAPQRSLQYGLPLIERAAGRSQTLVDFSDSYEADEQLFEIPASFDRRPMFAPGAI